MAKVKVSEIIKQCGLPSSYTDKVTNWLKESEYGNSMVSGFTGATVEGNYNEICDYIKKKAEEWNAPSNSASDNEELSKWDISAKYAIKGVRGRKIWIFEDRCIIKVEPTTGALLTGNTTDGEKTIFFHDCIGVQFKETGAILGYLQFETASGLMNNSASNLFNENTFTFDTTVATNEEMRKVCEYVISRIALYKKPPYSVPEEIIKYKTLLESNVITQEEFDKKKLELLSL